MQILPIIVDYLLLLGIYRINVTQYKSVSPAPLLLLDKTIVSTLLLHFSEPTCIVLYFTVHLLYWTFLYFTLTVLYVVLLYTYCAELFCTLHLLYCMLLCFTSTVMIFLYFTPTVLYVAVLNTVVYWNGPNYLLYCLQKLSWLMTSAECAPCYRGRRRSDQQLLLDIKIENVKIWVFKMRLILR